MNSVVSAASYLPALPVLQRGVRLLARFAQEGAVRTHYGFRIQYGPSPPEAAGLRRAVISGNYETNFFRALRRYATDVVVDVGAHEGFVSLFLAQSGRPVIACEPNPENLIRLRQNVALNPSLQITVEPYAVGDIDGEVDFHFAEGGGAWGSITRVPTQHTKTIRAKLQTLNTIVARNCSASSRVSLIKIDTEGNELAVLRGADEVISRHRPALCFEVSLTYWASARGSVDDLLGLVPKFGYRLFQVNEAGDLVQFQWLNRRIDNLFALPD